MSERTDEWLRLMAQLEDEIAAMGYDPEELPATTWLTARVTLAMAEATANNDGSFRGVRVAVTSMYFYARTLVATCSPSWREDKLIGPEAARRKLEWHRSRHTKAGA